jgi:hypothetical protein
MIAIYIPVRARYVRSPTYEEEFFDSDGSALRPDILPLPLTNICVRVIVKKPLHIAHTSYLSAQCYVGVKNKFLEGCPDQLGLLPDGHE